MRSFLNRGEPLGKRVCRTVSCVLILLLLISLLVGCAPRGVYTNALGASYRFKMGGKYEHTDSLGNVTRGKYEIGDGTLTLTPRDGTPFSLPFEKDGSSLRIGGIVYVKE